MQIGSSSRTHAFAVRPLAVGALAALVLGAFACFGVPEPASAEEPTRMKGELDFEITLEPADLAAGGSGTLVIKGKLVEEHYHIFANDSAGNKPLAWKPLEADGVTYETEGALRSKTHEYDDGYAKQPVYTDELEWRIPVTLGKDVKPGTRLGISISYEGCTDKQCYGPFTDMKASLLLGGEPGPQLSAPPSGQDANGVDVALSAREGALVVTFSPVWGHHIYGRGAEMGIPVSVEPIEGDGVTWGSFDVPSVGESHAPIVVVVPYERTTATELKLNVGWQVCVDGEGGQCFSPGKAVMVASWDGPAVTEQDEVIPVGDLLFPVIDGDELQVKTESKILDFYNEHGLLVLGLIFGLGVLLAFTPCVLPIIPITVSVITGGRADIPKRRLLGLLTVYVGSLALAFGIMGVITASLGGTMSAAFQEPGVIIGISVLFAVLAFGMLGIFELQPPQWMLRVQGGAQQKGGSYLGAMLLGGLMAIVASPCTGPFIVGMGLVAAKTHSPTLGFAMFSSMGLGMGAVLFAFGALNFAMRPGPWMVWVRYGFGMLLFGGALYQVAFPGILPPIGVVIAGVLFATLSGVLVWWHLAHKEGETHKKTLLTRSLGAGGMLAFAALLVLLLTARGDAIEFEKLRDVDHLKERVAESVEQGKPVVVDVWAHTCFYCKKYEELILEKPELRAGFEQMTRLKIDTSNGDQAELRDALGIPRGTQPFFVFFDREGRIRRAADIAEWHGDKSAEALKERLQLVLGAPDDAKTTESASR